MKMRSDGEMLLLNTIYAVISRRFDTSYARVVRAVHNNEVGDIQVMSLTSRDSPKPSYDFLASIGTSVCCHQWSFRGRRKE